MDGRESNVLEMADGEYRVSSPDYGEMIIEMVHKIKDEKFLRRLYIIIGDYIKEKSE